jgi:hypothetical protein
MFSHLLKSLHIDNENRNAMYLLCEGIRNARNIGKSFGNDSANNYVAENGAVFLRLLLFENKNIDIYSKDNFISMISSESKISIENYIKKFDKNLDKKNDTLLKYYISYGDLYDAMIPYGGIDDKSIYNQVYSNIQKSKELLEEKERIAKQREKAAEMLRLFDPRILKYEFESDNPSINEVKFTINFFDDGTYTKTGWKIEVDGGWYATDPKVVIRDKYEIIDNRTIILRNFLQDSDDSNYSTDMDGGVYRRHLRDASVRMALGVEENGNYDCSFRLSYYGILGVNNMILTAIRPNGSLCKEDLLEYDTGPIEGDVPE